MSTKASRLAEMHPELVEPAVRSAIAILINDKSGRYCSIEGRHGAARNSCWAAYKLYGCRLQPERLFRYAESIRIGRTNRGWNALGDGYHHQDIAYEIVKKVRSAVASKMYNNMVHDEAWWQGRSR